MAPDVDLIFHINSNHNGIHVKSIKLINVDTYSYNVHKHEILFIMKLHDVIASLLELSFLCIFENNLLHLNWLCVYILIG